MCLLLSRCKLASIDFKSIALIAVRIFIQGASGATPKVQFLFKIAACTFNFLSYCPLRSIAARQFAKNSPLDCFFALSGDAHCIKLSIWFKYLKHELIWSNNLEITTHYIGKDVCGCTAYQFYALLVHCNRKVCIAGFYVPEYDFRKLVTGSFKLLFVEFEG